MANRPPEVATILEDFQSGRFNIGGLDRVDPLMREEMLSVFALARHLNGPDSLGGVPSQDQMLLYGTNVYDAVANFGLRNPRHMSPWFTREYPRLKKLSERHATSILHSLMRRLFNRSR